MLRSEGMERPAAAAGEGETVQLVGVSLDPELAAVVGVVIIAVLVPLYDLTNSIG